MARNSITDVQHAFLEILQQCLGNVTTACKRCGEPASTHVAWMSESAQYRREVKEIQNMALDYAESKLFERIKKGDTRAITFYLERRGRERGYGKQEAVPIDDVKPIIINWSDDEEDKILKLGDQE